MWVYKYSKKETRYHVPKYWTYLKENQDALKMWFEDMADDPKERIPFSLRVIQYFISVCILYVFVYAFINPQGEYYQENCQRR